MTDNQTVEQLRQEVDQLKNTIRVSYGTRCSKFLRVSVFYYNYVDTYQIDM